MSDLAETIEILEAEITRLKTAKENKSKHLDAAAALFGPKNNANLPDASGTS